MVEIVPTNVRGVVTGTFLFLMDNIGGQIPLAVSPISDRWGLRNALYMIWPGCVFMGKIMIFLVVHGQIQISVFASSWCDVLRGKLTSLEQAKKIQSYWLIFVM